MADSAQKCQDRCSSDTQRNPKERKIRKGTRSCWECKRRKARCSLSQTRDVAVCDGCKRRGTRCVGQQYPDTPSKPHIGERLGRVGYLLTRLDQEGLAKTTANDSVQLENVRRAELPDSRYTSQPPQSALKEWASDIVPPNDELAETYSPVTSTEERTSRSGQTNDVRCPPIGEPICQKLSKISNALLSAWPTAHDLEVLADTPTSTASVFRGLIFVSYQDFTKNPLPSPRELFVRPDSHSHPVLIARKLLLLAVFLQNLSAIALAHVSDRLVAEPAELMESAFDAATQLVTNNDDLNGSIEGIECLMIVSLYLNNFSRLRLAYLTIRRALVIAQMIGIDQGTNSPRIRIIDSQTRNRIKPEYIWFRLVQTDRYLSLQQGLPQGFAGNAFAIENGESSLSREEKLELILTIAAGQIIQRNSASMLDIEATRKVDQMLLKGADAISPQWWLCPNQIDALQDERAIFGETARFTLQLAYFEILQRLHLPFLLQSSNSHDCDYSKMVAVTASREVLTRYIVFRCSSPPKGTYCRGIDFLAFSASVVTCLGHINLRLRKNSRDTQWKERSNAAFDCLAHQRMSDRGRVERALACLEKALEDDPSDKTAQKICRGIRYLLAVEGDVASGMAYRTESVYRTEDAREELGCENQSGEDGRAIRIHIPHLGMIKIQPNGATGTLYMCAPSADTIETGSSLQNTDESDNFVVSHTYSSVGGYCENTEANIGAQPWLFGDLGSLCFNLQEPQGGQWPITGNGWEDEWALEGVNSAFFDSLFSGSHQF